MSAGRTGQAVGVYYQGEIEMSAVLLAVFLSFIAFLRGGLEIDHDED